jgi:caspase domain-containing protein
VVDRTYASSQGERGMLNQGQAAAWPRRGARQMRWARAKTTALALLPLAVALICATGPARAEKRVALVIGNSAYQNVTRLDNPKNDARLMADTLTGLGFTLIGNAPQIDLDKPAFDGVLQKFGNAVLGADVALFYYAGHGLQIGGRNFLVPITANPTKEADVYLQMVDTNVVLSQMEGAGTKLNIVVLDACRNNPFGGRGLRATGGGLAQMQAPEGTLISYATQPGNVAQDGDGGNSPYSRALAKTIRRPGLALFEAFNEVGLEVKHTTGGSQQPWVSSSPIAGTFYFSALPANGAAAEPPKQPAPAEDKSSNDFDFAQKLDKLEVWEAFVQNYPSGLRASVARMRIDELKKKQIALASPSQSIPPPPAPSLTGSISGVWSGTYFYPNGNQPVAFTFTFGSNGCSGRGEEPNTFGDKSAPKLFANLSCSAATLTPGQVITIRKNYDGTGGVSHSVTYTGTVSQDLRTISGHWAINATRGNFRMSR